MAYSTEQAQAQFDEWSGSYDSSWLQRAFFGPSHRMILQNLKEGEGRLLDVGCGTGKFLAQILGLRLGMDVVGLDLSEPMLDQCQARCRPWDPRMSVVRADSQRLPFADDSFDMVTCSHSFHHYPDQSAVVKEMYRVLRPGGQLLLIDGYRDLPLGWFMFDVVVTWMEGEVKHCSARQLRELFRAAGFGDIRQQVRRLPIPFMLTVGHVGAKEAIKPLTQAA